MSKLTLDSLRKLREEKKRTIAMRDTENKDVQIIIGMGTCGIAAGAKDTFGAIIDAITERKMTNVLIRQTGCMGLCHSEPTVEVVAPDMPIVIYGNVDKDVAREIIEKHVVGRQLLDNHICDKPASDIIQ